MADQNPPSPTPAPTKSLKELSLEAILTLILVFCGFIVLIILAFVVYISYFYLALDDRLRNEQTRPQVQQVQQSRPQTPSSDPPLSSPDNGLGASTDDDPGASTAHPDSDAPASDEGAFSWQMDEVDNVIMQHRRYEENHGVPAETANGGEGASRRRSRAIGA